MMNDIKVSIIIPVYNTGLYIEQCLDSIINQTFQDLEIICVDDGSTDSTPSILEYYERKFDNIHVVKQQNKYAGVARNTGLAQAQGEYVMFLDSDDFFEPSMLSEMYDKITRTASDICICNARAYDNRTGTKINKHYLYTKAIPSKDPFSWEDLPDSIYQVMTPSAWKLMIRKSFIEENNLCFEACERANDLMFFGMVMPAARRITIVNKKFVNYRIGLSNSIQSRHDYEITSEYETLRKIRAYLVEKGMYDNIKVSFNALANRTMRYLLSRMKCDELIISLRDYIIADENPVLSREEVDELFPVPHESGSEDIIIDSIIPPAMAEGTDNRCMVSVIVPTFNDEKYIMNCLNSIASQDFSNFEIVIIDDGSTDGTSQLCKNFALEHADSERFKVVYVKQKNQGLSGARNQGLAHASGKYLKFLDGDDMYRTNCLAACVGTAEAYGTEILCAGIEPFIDELADVNNPELVKVLEGYQKYYSRTRTYSLVRDGRELFAILKSSGEFIPQVSTLTMNRDFLDSIGLDFYHLLHEDECFTALALFRAKKAFVINDITVDRRIRANSIMTRDDNLISKATSKLRIGYHLFMEMYGDATSDDVNWSSEFEFYWNRNINVLAQAAVSTLVDLKGRNFTLRAIESYYDLCNPYYCRLYEFMRHSMAHKKSLRENDELRSELKTTKGSLKKIKNSRGWRFILWIRKLTRFFRK